MLDWYKNEYFLRRLHSILAIFPLTIFMMEHLLVNFTALYGAATYNQTVAILQSLPFLPFMEMVLIVIPLAFHALFGIYIVYLAKNNVLTYNYYRNWAFFLQRITAVITFVYVIYHVWALRIAHVIFDFDINFETVGAHLANPLVFWIYSIGIIASMYHFTNGLTTFLISWGITVGPHSQRTAMWIGNAVFVFLAFMGISVILAFN